MIKKVYTNIKVNLILCLLILGFESNANAKKNPIDTVKPKIGVVDILDYYKSQERKYLENKDLKKAFYYSDLFLKAKDSIFNAVQSRTITETSTKYKLERRLKDVELLKKENEIKAYEVEKQRKRSLSLIIISLIGVILVVFIYLLIRILQKNKFNKAMIVQQKKNIISVSEIQDKERIRISNNLNDGVAKLLADAETNLGGLKVLFEESNKLEMESYNKALGLLNEANEELSLISQQIIPQTLTRNGIIHAIEELLELNLKPINIKYKLTHNIDSIQEQTEFQIYRVVQELINNIVKHASANNVTLNFEQRIKELDIMIEDDGVGYDKNKIKDGIGLINITSRVNSLNGVFSITKGRNNGTKVSIVIPNSY